MRAKTIITCRKTKGNMRFLWIIKIGNRSMVKRGPGIYELFTLVCKLLEDRDKIYSVDIQVKRKQ